MAEGTRQAAVNEALAALKEEGNNLREEQRQQRNLLEAVLQKLGQLATNYEHLSHSNPLNPDAVETSVNLRENSHHRSMYEGTQMVHAKSLKLDFPKFDGNEPLEWLLKVDQFFEYFQTPENQKLDIAFFHMEGKALAWFVWLKESTNLQSWDQFTSALKVRFGPSAFDDPVGSFTKLVQLNSVEEYQSQFEFLSNKVKGLSEEFRISTFISGLKEEIKLTVTMFKPTSLSAAFGLAKLQEEEVSRRQKSTFPRNSSNVYTNNLTYNTKASSSIPTTKNAVNTTTKTEPKPNYPSAPFMKKPAFPIKRLTPTQMQERREKGLCYNCDEKFHIGHRCKSPKLFILEGIEGPMHLAEEGDIIAETEPDVEEANEQVQEGELLGISMYAISGAFQPNTMRIQGLIKQQPVEVLIDTGSTQLH